MVLTPNAKIVCMLGNMDITQKGSKWPKYIKKAVYELEDNNIHTHFVKYKNSPGHPTIIEQEDMANSLIEFIETNIDW